MTLRSIDYASLAQDSYNDPVLFQQTPIGGLEYKPIAFENDPKTGFQAKAYEHINTNGSHEVVIAYRGTEFGREPRQDGLTDAGMALAGVNAQTAQSEAFTQRVLTLAEDRANKDHHSLLNITVTGHSLGGTLAEINAYKFGLHGETFNAYGAAGLLQGVPAGGHQVIDHIRATDVVSAGSPHFGEVRTYATQQDIDAISKAGYSNTNFLNELPAHAPVLGMIQADAHYVSNFAPDPRTHQPSLLSAENAQRAQANAVMINAYRGDIGNARALAGVPGELGTMQAEALTTGIGMGVRAGEAVAHGMGVAAHDVAQATGRGLGYLEGRAVQGARDVNQAVLLSAPPRMDDPSHPDHVLFKQAREGVHRLDAQQGRTPDQHSDNLAASLTVAAKAEGFKRIDQVALSDDGSRAFAVQQVIPGAFKNIAPVETAQAVNMPIEQSTQQLAHVNQQQAQVQAQQQAQVQNQPQAAPQQAGPALTR